MDDQIKAPSWLNSDAKAKFKLIHAALSRDGKWRDGDDIALSALCASYQHWIEAEKAIKKNGNLCFTTETGYRQQIPEISIANNAMKQMLSFIKEFALTPRERSKLKELILEADDNSDYEMEDMIQK
ncbi:phage terminase small subunit P27 family [Paenibacillus sp. J5C_2022]|uniref:phage terminase small subunit P27 family n=1 Tax=Paenibacillus sp. J5C2022 TaxID=2977129 RepID=UPI0021D24995|nr:phage terminase small subunit P27 family [Paenibacillus sp. J5C2022]MCU6709412.1 phage terminase small subunit P27 family [Paenibacillus sp. J5C2022]